MNSSYFIGVYTGVDYDSTEYEAAAGRLATMMATAMASKSLLASLTRNAEITSAKTAREISLECLEGGARQLIAEAVLDISGPGRVTLDKAKLSKWLKGTPEASEWPQMKISKRQIFDIQ